VTAQSREEALADGELLRAAGWRVAGVETSENAFHSLLPRQSGTLANDVYRKNGWIGAFGVPQRNAESGTAANQGGGKPSDYGSSSHDRFVPRQTGEA
jgi:hypothetical protein